MPEPTSRTSHRIKEVARLRIEGASWDKIAQLYGYKNGVSARKTLQGEHPMLWKQAFESARIAFLDEIESEAILTNRELLRPTKTDGAPRDESIRQRAAHSLQSHAAKLRAQKIELSGPEGKPVTLQQCQTDKDWLKKRKKLLVFYAALSNEQRDKLLDALE